MKIKLTYNLTILVIDKWLIWQWEICIHTDSPSVAHGLRYFSTQES